MKVHWCWFPTTQMEQPWQRSLWIPLSCSALALWCCWKQIMAHRCWAVGPLFDCLKQTQAGQCGDWSGFVRGLQLNVVMWLEGAFSALARVQRGFLWVTLCVLIRDASGIHVCHVQMAFFMGDFRPSHSHTLVVLQLHWGNLAFVSMVGRPCLGLCFLDDFWVSSHLLQSALLWASLVKLFACDWAARQVASKEAVCAWVSVFCSAQTVWILWQGCIPFPIAPCWPRKFVAVLATSCWVSLPAKINIDEPSISHLNVECSKHHHAPCWNYEGAHHDKVLAQSLTSGWLRAIQCDKCLGFLRSVFCGRHSVHLVQHWHPFVRSEWFCSSSCITLSTIGSCTKGSHCWFFLFWLPSFPLLANSERRQRADERSVWQMHALCGLQSHEWTTKQFCDVFSEILLWLSKRPMNQKNLLGHQLSSDCWGPKVQKQCQDPSSFMQKWSRWHLESPLDLFPPQSDTSKGMLVIWLNVKVMFFELSNQACVGNHWVIVAKRSIQDNLADLKMQGGFSSFWRIWLPCFLLLSYLWWSTVGSMSQPVFISFDLELWQRRENHNSQTLCQWGVAPWDEHFDNMDAFSNKSETNNISASTPESFLLIVDHSKHPACKIRCPC